MMNLVLVGISGPSSAGKSTVVKSLVSVLPSCTEIHLDDFYFPDAQIPIDEKHGVQNWDCADALDWNKFKKYLHSVKASNGDILPVESRESTIELGLTEPEKEKIQAELAAEYPWLAQSHVVFVDGFMLFHDSSVADLLDVKILFRAPYATLKQRRESRKGYNTIEGFWSDPPGYFDNIVWPAYVASHKHLFEGEDVDASLSEQARVLGICDIRNDGSHDLPTLVMTALESIAQGAKHVAGEEN